MMPSARARLMWKLADLIEEHTDELAELESLDNGKPFAVAKAADVPLAAELFRYMAGWATKLEGSTIPLSVITCRDRCFMRTRGASRSAWSGRSSRGISRC